MKFAQLSILAVLAIASQGAFAQSPSPMRPSSPSGSSSSMGSPGGSAPGGAATGASDSGTITNEGSGVASAIVTDDTTVTTDSMTATADVAPTGEMANTGGEPELMLLAGVLLASGGLLIRRKTSAHNP